MDDPFDPDLASFVKDAEKQRAKGGRLERVPRAVPAEHRCTPPTAKEVDIKVGDVWHCDCGRSYEYKEKYGPARSVLDQENDRMVYLPSDPVYVWDERVPWQRRALYTLFTGIPILAFIAMLGRDPWYHDLGWFVLTVAVMTATRQIALRYYTPKEVE